MGCQEVVYIDDCSPLSRHCIITTKASIILIYFVSSGFILFSRICATYSLQICAK